MSFKIPGPGAEPQHRPPQSRTAPKKVPPTRIADGNDRSSSRRARTEGIPYLDFALGGSPYRIVGIPGVRWGGEPWTARAPVADRLLSWPLVISLVLIVALLILNIAVVSWSIGRISRDTRQIAHTKDVRVSLEILVVSLREAQGSERGYLLTGDSGDLEPYRTASVAVNGEIRRLKRLTADDPQEQGRVSVLEAAVGDGFRQLERVIASRRTDPETAWRLVAAGGG